MRGLASGNKMRRGPSSLIPRAEFKPLTCVSHRRNMGKMADAIGPGLLDSVPTFPWAQGYGALGGSQHNHLAARLAPAPPPAPTSTLEPVVTVPSSRWVSLPCLLCKACT